MKVLLADDHKLFLDGIAALLQSLDRDMIIECVSDGGEALEKLRSAPFDVAMIDLRLPVLDGFALLDRLAEKDNLVPVIIVSASEDPDDIQQAFGLGAAAFVPKSTPGKQIFSAINRVLAGEVVLPQQLDGEEEPADHDARWARMHHITPRQLEVLRLMRQGLSNQTIAERLFISLATVKTHINAIFESLGVSSRTEAIRRAQQLGLD